MSIAFTRSDYVKSQCYWLIWRCWNYHLCYRVTSCWRNQYNISVGSSTCDWASSINHNTNKHQPRRPSSYCRGSKHCAMDSVRICCMCCCWTPRFVSKPLLNSTAQPCKASPTHAPPRCINNQLIDCLYTTSCLSLNFRNQSCSNWELCQLSKSHFKLLVASGWGRSCRALFLTSRNMTEYHLYHDN